MDKDQGSSRGDIFLGIPSLVYPLLNSHDPSHAWSFNQSFKMLSEATGSCLNNCAK